MATQQVIQRCIDRCARAKAGRGRWRAENDCFRHLAGQGSDAVAADVAAAARRIGEWLATRPGLQPVVPVAFGPGASSSTC